jgi:hypothetical protein
VSKFSGKFRNYDDDENANFQPRKKKRDQQKTTRSKSNYDDYDYFMGNEDYQKSGRRKAKQF